MEDVMIRLQELIAFYGLKVLAAIVILILGRFAAKAIRAVVLRMLQKTKLETALVSFIASLCYVAVMAFVIIAALSKIGVETASFVVVLGSAGLAIGLALQGSLANFAAGVLILAFKPFKVGDYIEGGGVAGSVEQIGIFTTDLASPDNKKIIVPNGKMMSDSIVNYTVKGTRRVDIVAGVSYGDDLDKVRRVLGDILSGDDRILKDPAPVIAVSELGDSSVNFVVRPWVKTADYWAVYFATQESIKKRFDAEGISIPFPQRDVHMINEAD